MLKSHQVSCRSAVSPAFSLLRVLTKALVLLLCVGGVFNCAPVQAQPAAPTGVTAITYPGYIRIQWNQQVVTGMKILRSGTSGGPYTQIGISNQYFVNYYNDTNALTGQNYYVVQGYNSSGSSVYSAEVSAWGPLSAPTNVAATPGNNSVTLTWSPVSGPVEKYKIQRTNSTNNGQPTGFDTKADTTSTSWTDTGRTNGVTYYYRILTNSAYGDSAPSPVVSAIPAPLPAPTNLTATGYHQRVDLSWDAVPGATQYNVQFNASGPTSNYNSAGTPTTNSFSHTGRTNGVTYYYRVFATNSNGNGLWSEVKSATPSANIAPVANNNSYSTSEDSALTVAAPGVLGNDTDANNNTLTAIKVTNPSNGTATLNSNGSFTYTPNANWNGTDSFTYKANDGALDSNVATVTITVDAVNDAPKANSDNVNTREDKQNEYITLSASDQEGSALTYAIVTQPLNGTLTGTAPNLIYKPNANYHGTDSFIFTATDSAGATSNGATVNITINSVNDAPSFTKGSEQNVIENSGAHTVTNWATNISPGPANESSQTVSFIVTNDNNALFSAQPAISPNSTLTYTLATGQTGTATVVVSLQDNGGTDRNGIDTSAPQQFAINVAPENEAPVANSQNVTTNEDSAVDITLLATDADGAALIYSIVTQPSNGTLSGTGANRIYTPNPNFYGTDSFVFKANDGELDGNGATVSIVVSAVNDAPSFTKGSDQTVNEDSGAQTVPNWAAAISAGPNESGQTLNFLVSNSNNALFSSQPAISANGTLTFTPAPDKNGSATVTVSLKDNGDVANGGVDTSAAQTFVITITPVNDAPVAQSQSVSAVEDTAKSITLSATDVDGDALTYSIVSQPSHGTLSGTAPNLTYTPASNYNGADSFVFVANDGTVDSNGATVSIIVSGQNDAPVANDQSLVTPEDVAKAITLSGSDADGNPLTYSIVSQPSHGALSGSLPNVTYTPNANYNGADSFTFKITDNSGEPNDASNIAMVSIAVESLNDAPVANADSGALYTVNEDGVLTIAAPGVLANDTDADGDSLTAIKVTDPTHGSLTLNANGSFTYTPNANYSGADSFTYKANDGTADSNGATVSIVVSGQNDVPVANDQSVVTSEDVAKSITLTGSDADNDALTYIIVAQPAHGTLSGSGANRTYTPSANRSGSDSFTFKVNDGTVDSNVATVSITVTPVNDVPVANAQTLTIPEEATSGILLTGSDVDGDTLSYTIVSQPTHGILTGTAPELTYVSHTNYNGPDSFTFKVNDGTVDSGVATISINVVGQQDAPVANNQSVTTSEDTAKAITLAASDVDGDALQYSIVAQPSNGTLTGTGANRIYTPNTNYHGSDSFTFKVNDGIEDSNTATVSITVTPVNDAPVASTQSVSAVEDTAKSITLSATDVDGDALTYSIVSQPSHGTLSGTAPNLNYTPVSNYNGADSFVFVANDGTVDSNGATVSIIVSGQNDAPVANDQSIVTSEDVAKSITLSGSDADNDTLTYSIESQPAHGTLSGSAPNVIYTPHANYHGDDSFTFNVNDGTADSNTATLNITITSVNDTPVVVDDSGYVTIEDTPLIVAAPGVLSNDIDAEGGGLTAVKVTGPSHGALNLNADGSFTYTPDSNWTGTDSFTYKANSGDVSSNTATVNITVQENNDAPVPNDQTVTTLHDTAKSIVLSATDADGNALTYSIVRIPSHGVLSGVGANRVYTPNAGYIGTDSFTFKVNDGFVDSNIAVVNIIVSADTNPTPAPPTAQIPQGQTGSFRTDASLGQYPSMGQAEIRSPGGSVVASFDSLNGSNNGWTLSTNYYYQGTGVYGYSGTYTVTVPVNAPIATGYTVRSQGPNGAYGGTFAVISGAPAVPANLRATAGKGVVSLAWGKSANAASYTIKRAAVSGGPYTIISTTTQLGYVDPDVVNGATYYYVVNASNAAGTSADSNEASATPSNGLLPAPANLTATPGDGQVKLTWSAVSGAVNYHVKRATQPGGPYVILETVTATTYTDTGVNNGTTYYYIVTAVNGAGEGSPSSEVSTKPQAPPTAPLNLTATLGYQRILLSWNASARAANYEVWRSINGGNFALLATVNALTYKDEGLTNGTPYQYYVRAWNVGGYSAQSNIVSATPTELPPAAPGSPLFSNITMNSIRVTAPALPWNATSLTLQRSYGYSDNFETIATGLSGGEAFDATGLSPSTTYYFRYVAVGEGGAVPGYSDSKTTLPPPPHAPSIPVFRSVQSTSVQVLTGQLPPFATSLTLQKKLASDQNAAYADVQTGISGNYGITVSGLAPATEYSFRLVAIGQGGTTVGESANVITAPAAPGLPAFSDTTATSVRVTAPSLPIGAQSLSLQRRYTSGGASDYVTVASNLAGNTQTLVTGLEGATGYLFRYVAIGVGGSTPGAWHYINTLNQPSGDVGAPRFTNVQATQVSVISPVAPSGTYYLTLQKKLASEDDSAYTDCISNLYYDGPGAVTTVTGLTSGTAYSFRYIANGSTNGQGANVTTAPAAPGQPEFSDITAVSVKVTAPTLPPGVSSLTLQRRQSGDYSWPFEDVENGLTSGAITQVTGLNHSTTYEFRYLAVGEDGSTAGYSRTVTTLPPVPLTPDTPKFFAIQATQLSVMSPPLPPYAQTMHLQKKLASEPVSAFANVSTDVYGGYRSTIYNLTATTAYTFRFVAVGQGGTTVGPEGEVTTLPPAPEAPNAPAMSNVGNTTATAELPALPERATSLTLQQRMSYSYVWTDIAVDRQAGDIIQVTNLSPGTPYTFRCIAVGPGGSTEGDGAGITTAGGAPPAPDAPLFRDVEPDSVTVVVPELAEGEFSLKLQRKISSQPDSAYEDIANHVFENGVTVVSGLDSGQSYDFRYIAQGASGNTPGAVGTIVMPVPIVNWSAGTAISSGGIRYPSTGATLAPGAEGRVSAYLATDWDVRGVTLNGSTTLGEYSDPCSYTWSATGGSFKNGVNKGQSAIWVAPTTSGTYTVTLVVDDQASANKPNNEGGLRSDGQRGYNDEPLRFSVTVTVP